MICGTILSVCVCQRNVGWYTRPLRRCSMKRRDNEAVVLEASTDDLPLSAFEGAECLVSCLFQQPRLPFSQ